MSATAPDAVGLTMRAYAEAVGLHPVDELTTVARFVSLGGMESLPDHLPGPDTGYGIAPHASTGVLVPGEGMEVSWSN